MYTTVLCMYLSLVNKLKGDPLTSCMDLYINAPLIIVKSTMNNVIPTMIMGKCTQLSS